MALGNKQNSRLAKPTPSISTLLCTLTHLHLRASAGTLAAAAAPVKKCPPLKPQVDNAHPSNWPSSAFVRARANAAWPLVFTGLRLLRVHLSLRPYSRTQALQRLCAAPHRAAIHISAGAAVSAQDVTQIQRVKGATHMTRFWRPLRCSSSTASGTRMRRAK